MSMSAVLPARSSAPAKTKDVTLATGISTSACGLLIGMPGTLRVSLRFGHDEPRRRGALADRAGLAVLRRVVPPVDGRAVGELEHDDALGIPVALEHLGVA